MSAARTPPRSAALWALLAACVTATAACGSGSGLDNGASCHRDADCRTSYCHYEALQGVFQCACMPPNYTPCRSDADCCTNSCVAGRCGCASSGAPCSEYSDCCGTLLCLKQACRANAGERCASDAVCASGRCSGGECACSPNGASCFDDKSCCGGLTCAKPVDAERPNTPGYCCLALGAACAADGECCSKACGDGKCIERTPGCRPPLRGCIRNEDCCSNACVTFVCA